jgi:hypothetical protein
MQLPEFSPIESELNYKWTHCAVHLENIDIKDVKVTVVAWLLHGTGQFIVQCIH